MAGSVAGCNSARAAPGEKSKIKIEKQREKRENAYMNVLSLLSSLINLLPRGVRMPSKTQDRKTDEVSEFRRVTIKVPLNIAMLIDLVANYQPCTKNDLAVRIWQAGLCALFELDEADLEDLLVRPLPRGTQPPKEVHLLVDRLLVDG